MSVAVQMKILLQNHRFKYLGGFPRRGADITYNLVSTITFFLFNEAVAFVCSSVWLRKKKLYISLYQA